MKPKKVTLPSGEIRWEIRVRIKSGSHICRRFPTEREAKSELARIHHEQNQGVYVHPDRNMTLKVLAARAAAAASSRRKVSTVRHYEDALRPLLDKHGDLKVGDLTSQHLIALRDAMLEGRLRRVGVAGKPLSPRSVNAMLGAVHGVLAYGIHERVLTHNVADKLSVARARDNEVEEVASPGGRDAWQDEHLNKFRIAVVGEAWEHAWLLSAIGLRRGEVLGLQWSDIDLEQRTVTIRRNRTVVAGVEIISTPKSKASRRTLPLSPRLVETLKNTPRRGDWVVADAAGDRPRPELYSDTFSRLIEDQGLPKTVLHGVRHAVASAMANQGVPLASIAKWLGQSQQGLAVTLGYTHARNADADTIRDLLN